MKDLIICGENFVNDQNTYTVSSGDSSKDKVYDQKPNTKWETSGSAEGNSETFQCDFYNRVGTAVQRTFDRIILLNCNLAKFKIERWDGAAWQNISEADFTVTPNGDANVYIEMAASVTTYKIKITATNTIGAAAEKNIGELKACLFIVELANKVDFARHDWSNAKSYRLYGGPLVTFTDVSKVEATVKFSQVTITNYELLKDKIRDREWMTWVLYEDFRRADIYEFKAITDWQESFNHVIERYDLTFDVGER